MTLLNALKSARQTATSWLWKNYAGDVGRSLIDLGALGWILSAAAQIGMIKKRKDIDEKEKDFLLTQEKADGVFNVVSYYTLCEAIKQTGDLLLEKGHIMTKRTLTSINYIKKSTNSIKDFVQSMNETVNKRKYIKTPNKLQSMTNFYKGCIYILEKLQSEKNEVNNGVFQYTDWTKKILKNDKIIKETFEPLIQNGEIDYARRVMSKAFKDYSSFKTGVGVFAAVFASVLSCNIITPIVRNKTANYFHNKKMKYYESQELKKKSDASQYAYTKIPLSKTYNSFKV